MASAVLRDLIKIKRYFSTFRFLISLYFSSPNIPHTHIRIETSCLWTVVRYYHFNKFTDSATPFLFHHYIMLPIRKPRWYHIMLPIDDIILCYQYEYQDDTILRYQSTTLYYATNTNTNTIRYYVTNTNVSNSKF